MIQRYLRAIIASALPLMFLGLGACSKKTDNRSECPYVDSDQWDSFQKYSVDLSRPLTVDVDAQFSPQEQSEILSAVTKWNQSAQSVRGESIFFPRVVSLTPDQVPTSRNPDSFRGAPQKVLVVRAGDASLESRLGLAPSASQNTNGVTLQSFDGEMVISTAIVLNLVSANPAQLEVATLHELGHALGLKHSCNEGSDSDHFVSCNNLPSERADEYQNAVMFPRLGYQSDLQSNDRARARCRLERDFE